MNFIKQYNQWPIVLLLCLFQGFACANTASSVDENTQKLVQEFELLKKRPIKKDLFTTILAYAGLLRVNNKSFPSLHVMTQNTATQLHMAKPAILCIKKNLFWHWLGILTGNDVLCNAFAWGPIPDFSFACVGEDLIKNLSYTELNTIVAHEFGHIVHYHMIQKIFAKAALYKAKKITKNTLRFMLFLIYLQILKINKHNIGTQQIFNILGICTEMFPVILEILLDAQFSRHLEKEADITSLDVIADPQYLSQALTKCMQVFTKKHPIWATFLRGFEKFVPCLLSHPPIEKRIRYLHKEAARRKNI